MAIEFIKNGYGFDVFNNCKHKIGTIDHHTSPPFTKSVFLFNQSQDYIGIEADDLEQITLKMKELQGEPQSVELIEPTFNSCDELPEAKIYDGQTVIVDGIGTLESKNGEWKHKKTVFME